jgi:hypothetical protein
LGALLATGTYIYKQQSAPVNTAAPVITGTDQVGVGPLVASTGTWTENPASFSYQWQRADNLAFTANVLNVGSDQASYALTVGDDGKYHRVQVTATNTSGSSTATSAVIGPTAGATAADFFVSTSGSGTACTLGNPCGSMNQAYATAAAVATSPKTVEMAGGSYGSQTCNSATRAGNGLITFRPAAGATVTTGGILFGSDPGGSGVWTTASCTYVKLLGTMSPTVGEGNSNFKATGTIILNGSADNITIDGLDDRNFRVKGSSNVLLTRLDDGPELVAKPGTEADSEFNQGYRQANGVGGFISNSNVTLSNSNIHEHNCVTLTDCQGGDAVHVQGLWLYSANGLTISGNKFWGNGITNMFRDNCGVGCTNTFQGVDIVNNWFGEALNCAGDTASTCTNFSSKTIFLQNNPATGSFKIRFNTFARHSYPLSCSSVSICGNATTHAVIAGNIGQGGANLCSFSNVDFSYNTWFRTASGDTACGGSNDTMMTWDPSGDGMVGKLVDSTSFVTFNFNLSGVNWAADNSIPCGSVNGGCPTPDRAGLSRPQNANADAGAAERNS